MGQEMDYLEIFGWLGAIFTLSAYSMRNMLPLRCIALAANVAFITYGALVPVYPMLALHVSLFPLNLFRLWEILVSMRRMNEARSSERPLDVLRPFLKPTRFSDGDVLFRRGDTPDRVYYVDTGTVELPELGEFLTAGTLFGEMAYFTDSAARTTSAICRSDCTILTIDEKIFMSLYRQHPEFGHYVIRLIAQRLIKGSSVNSDLYDGFKTSPDG